MPYRLNGVAFLTMFAREEPIENGRDLVIRTDRNDDALKHTRPPAKALLEQPNFIQFGPVEDRYPNHNDLPLLSRWLPMDVGQRVNESCVRPERAAWNDANPRRWRLFCA